MFDKFWVAKQKSAEVTTTKLTSQTSQVCIPFNANDGQRTGGGKGGKELGELGEGAEPVRVLPVAEDDVRVHEGHRHEGQGNIGDGQIGQVATDAARGGGGVRKEGRRPRPRRPSQLRSKGKGAPTAEGGDE